MSEWVSLQLSDSPPNPHVWSAKVNPGEGDHSQSITVHICSPVLSSVGLYRLLLHIETFQSQRTYALGSFVLLFNPWLKGGPQTLPLLSTMVIPHSCSTAFQMIQCTCLWMFRGTSISRATMGWCIWAAIRISVGDPGYTVRYVDSYSGITEANEVHLKVCARVCFQYEPGVLEACLQLLQVSPQHLSDTRKDYVLRADPVYISRVICAMVRNQICRCCLDVQ